MSLHPTVVIGGGVIGACAAYYLAREGVDVILLDRGDIAGEASGGNAGQMAIGHAPINRPGVTLQAIRWMVDRRSPLHISPRVAPWMVGWLWAFHRACSPVRLERSMRTLIELGLQTEPLIAALVREESIECAFREEGGMEVYRTARAFEEGRQMVRLLQRAGIDIVELSAADVMAREPALKPGVVGATLNRHNSSLDPALFVRGVAQAAERRGVVIRTGVAVSGLRVERGAVRGVETAQGDVIDASNVVLAAGVWSERLARGVGVPISLRAAKGYHRDIVQAEPRLQTPCVLMERAVAVTPLDGRLRLAGTLEFSGVNRVLRPERIDAIVHGAREYLTGVDAAHSISDWCGLRPCTADGLPIIGWAPGVSGLCIATGHAMLGMTLGPVTGRLVAGLVTGAQPSVDMVPLRVGTRQAAKAGPPDAVAVAAP
jgi:D-amino-acid dehydrogenase